MTTTQIPRSGPKTRQRTPGFVKEPLIKPEGLRDSVSQKWDQIVRTMPGGYFDLSDADMLEVYCETWIAWEEYRDVCVVEGRVDVNMNTERSFESANSKLERELNKQLNQMSKMLGLTTPASERTPQEELTTKTLLDGDR